MINRKSIWFILVKGKYKRLIGHIALALPTQSFKCFCVLSLSYFLYIKKESLQSIQFHFMKFGSMPSVSINIKDSNQK